MIEILLTHGDFYLCYKPHDVNFHDEGESGQGFFNRLKSQLNETIYPVHRLDKITSGIVIVARNKSAAQFFQQAFELGLIEKRYLAITKGKPKKKQGTVAGDMGKSRNGAWRLLKTNNNPAITQFFSWGDSETQNRMRYFLLRPISGKTHQLRVALKSLGSPILGDTLYNGASSDRGYLHACQVQFDYNEQTVKHLVAPKSGEHFINLPSQIWQQVIEQAELPWPKTKVKRKAFVSKKKED